MAMHVNFLPSEMLCAIFCLLPLRDLLRAGRVCTNWYKSRRIAGWKVHKLTLVFGGKLYEGYPNFTVGDQDDRILKDDGSVMFPQAEYPTRDFVHFKWLDLNALIGLTVLFPNVSKLEIACQVTSLNQLCAVTILLRLWQTKLVSFKFAPVYDGRTPNGRRFVRQIPIQIAELLLDAINSLPGLKNLSLCFRNTHFVEVDEYQVNLPILAQLEQFDFKSVDRNDVLFASLRDHTTNNARLRIRLETDMQWFDEQLNQYQQMGRLFELVVNEFVILRITELEKVSNCFNSLTALNLNIEHAEVGVSIQNLFLNLSKLTQLLHLAFSLSFEVMEVEEGDENAPLARLPSLKSLNLSARTRRHDNLALLDIPVTMPNLEAIDVSISGHHYVGLDHLNYRCAKCAIHDLSVTEPAQVKSCLSRMMLPLADCTQLHSITFFSYYDHPNCCLDDLGIDDLKRPLTFK